MLSSEEERRIKHVNFDESVEKADSKPQDKYMK